MGGFVSGIDIGSSRVRAVIGEVSDEGAFQITGIGSAPSTGLRKGVVVNMEDTVRAIAQAAETAEMMSGVEIQRCTVGLGGSHIESINSRGSVALPHKKQNYEIQNEDIARVLDVARAYKFPLDRQVIHVIPQSYTVDDEEGIRNPLGRIGVRLEAKVHIITGSITPIQGILKCVSRAEVSADEYMLASLAEIKSIMTSEEREVGSLLIDLGAGTTDIIYVVDGSPQLTAVLPIGGEYVTSDISKVKGLSMETSERIKCEAGYCWEPLIEEDLDVMIPGFGGRPPIQIPQTEICEIIQPRMEEIFCLAREKVAPVVDTQPFDMNVVLTGGGANLSGVAELAREVFGTPNVRIGIPGILGSLAGELGDYRSPEYAAVIGLVLNSYEKLLAAKPETHQKESQTNSVLELVKNWFKEFF